MINNIVVEGNLVKDVVLKSIPNSDKMVAEGTVACNDFRQDKPDYIPFKAWGQSAEYLAEKTSKGSHLIMVGKLKIKTYQNDNKEWKTSVYVNTSEVQNLDRGKTNVFDSDIETNLVKDILNDDKPFPPEE